LKINNTIFKYNIYINKINIIYHYNNLSLYLIYLYLYLSFYKKKKKKKKKKIAVPIQTEAVLTSISQASTPKYDSDEESLDEVVI